MLYYFRQENTLPKHLFINAHEIFARTLTDQGVMTHLQDPNLNRYIFIDDLCGSGDQANRYLANIIGTLKTLAPAASAYYFVLFATSRGLQVVRDTCAFDVVKSVFELDPSFKCLESDSRIFQGEDGPFDRVKIRSTCERLGQRLLPRHPLGFRDGQLLLGFNHNTPDNTLPIFWGGNEALAGPWRSIFHRYGKYD